MVKNENLTLSLSFCSDNDYLYGCNSRANCSTNQWIMASMKTLTLTMMSVFLFGCACPDLKPSGEYPKQEIRDETKSYTIYKHNSIIPEYEVRNGKIYKPGGIVPLYEIRGNKIYKPGGIVPLYELKEKNNFEDVVGPS
jgi:hypothetical protein